MMRNDNICKLVSVVNEKQMITTNFVLENKLENLCNIRTTDNHSVRIVMNGTGKLYTDKYIGALQPGTVFFTFPNVAYRIDADEGFNCMYITFRGTRAQELFQRFRISPEHCIFEGHDGLLAFWQNCLGKANEHNLDLISESVLLNTFAQLSPPVTTKKQQLINDVMEYVDNSFSDSELGLSTVAEKMGYSSKYLSKAFKENVGISFSEYVRNVRIQHAVFLIEHGITTVKNLALLCGFADPYYFSNVFKTVVGVYPSNYIQKNQ